MKTYTVKELIKVLQDLPPIAQEMPILDDCGEGIESISIIRDNCPFLPKDYVRLNSTTYDMN